MMSEAEIKQLVTPSVRAWLGIFLRFERDRLTWGNTMGGKVTREDAALLRRAHGERVAFLEFILEGRG